jgi:hypothetical protein
LGLAAGITIFMFQQQLLYLFGTCLPATPAFAAAIVQAGGGTILAMSPALLMSWFKVSDGRLRFRGRITRKPFVEWAATPDGKAAIETRAKEIRFALLGRTRAARRRLWRELESTIATDAVRAVLQSSPEYYMAAWTELAYAPALPRTVVSLRRLVVIPRTMVAARGRSALNSRLMTSSSYADLHQSLRAFLCDRLVWEMDDAIRRAKPSPHRPVEAREAWTCVALDAQFVWIDPLWSGPDCLGHVMMFEMPDGRPSRKERREIEAAIERLQGSLPAMSPGQRDGTVRSALAAMNPARV